jgi:hypothetical protein
MDEWGHAGRAGSTKRLHANWRILVCAICRLQCLDENNYYCVNQELPDLPIWRQFDGGRWIQKRHQTISRVKLNGFALGLIREIGTQGISGVQEII